MTERVQAISVERVVPADPNEVFDLLTDPAMHSVLDGSGTVRRSVGSAPERLRLGSKFSMEMRFGPLPYRITNRVVEFEANRLIAWCHPGRHRWRWELEAADGGTLVRETFDWSTALSPAALERLGFPQRNLDGMEKTLTRLVEHFEGVGHDDEG